MHTKHNFVSGKADGTDATLVKPSNWNADHVMTTDADGIVLGRAAGSGAGPVQELPFHSMGMVSETVLAVSAVEMRVTVPANAKYVMLQFLTLNVGNVNDTLKLNALNGSTIVSPATHQTQYLFGLGAAASGSFVNLDNGWQLGNTVTATQGTINPNWWSAAPNQMIGTANLWAINNSGSRYSIQTAFDGGPSVEPTGYRIANSGATFFAAGSFLRSFAAV